MKKKVIILSVLGILLLIGTSYAIWQLNFTQESANTLSAACFSITYSEQDNISLLNAYPMLDSEGETLTLSPLLRFNAGNNKYYLKCPSKRDAFTVSDITKGNGALEYPIGMLTITESYLVGNANARKTGDAYLSSTPHWFSSDNGASEYNVGTNGTVTSTNVITTWGARPAVSLKPGIKFVSCGDGTGANPYVVE